MGPYFDPFFGTLGSIPVNSQTLFARYCVQLVYPDGITGPDDGGKIPGLVQTFCENRQIRLPELKHPVESVAAIGGSHNASSPDFPEHGTPGKP
jgi:hypothetical protein